MILLGSDGIFDKLQNDDIFKIVREEARSHSEIMPSKI
jgi:serine/threonine protein phosphatase PrpC